MCDFIDISGSHLAFFSLPESNLNTLDIVVIPNYQPLKILNHVFLTGG